MENKRALTARRLKDIEDGYWTSTITDNEIMLLIESAKIYRDSVRYLVGLFQREPLKLISLADPIRNDTLDEIKQRCALEDV